MKRWHADLAWTGRLERSVLIEVEGSSIVRVESGAEMPPDATRLHGLALPGLANAHSHAFQRSLRGRCQAGAGNFWSWRQAMYAVAGGLDPDGYYELARATYAEMALAGITAVGEFHYVHHGPTGQPYPDPNAMGQAVIAAAVDAGIRITLIDTCYLRGGFGQPLEDAQRRFGDGDADAWVKRVSALEESPGVRIGAGIHSVRAVDRLSMETVRRWAAERGAPLHFHLSEQPAENEACLRATGRTPTQLLHEAGALGPFATAVHGTHLTPADIQLLGETATSVCMCPSTERDLADGIGPSLELSRAGSPLCLGSDSHASIDILEEARALELHQRLRAGRRANHDPVQLLEAATAGGMRALGWPAGRLERGALADFIAVTLRSPRTAGAGDHAVERVIFAATAADVTDVVVGGETVVAEGRHLAVGDVGEALTRALARVPAPAR